MDKGSTDTQVDLPRSWAPSSLQADTVYDREPVKEGPQLQDYLRILSRKRALILWCALAGALAGFLVDLGRMPVFQARTSLDIESLNTEFMNMRAVASPGESSGGDSGSSYVQTQIKLLQSETLLQSTVNALMRQPHPASIEREDLLSRMERTLHVGGDRPIPYEALVRDAAKRIKVKPLGLTRLVEVTCDSWNAQFSARFCNTLTSSFRDADYTTRGVEAAKTSDWLTRQVADVRAQVEASEKKLEEATGGNGLELSQQSDGVSEDRLRALQDELVRAQADRMDKQAQYEVSLTAAPDSLPSVLNSPNFREDQQRLEQLQSEIAKLVPPLTEANPRVIHLRSQIQEVQNQLKEERDTVIRSMRDQYESAKQREDLLSLTYQIQEEKTSTVLDKSNRVALLRREVDSEEQLYQNLLQRAKEAGFASAMQISTIRTVDAAKAPKVPVSPRRASTVGVGFLLGSLLGIGLALYKERTSGIIYAPGEAQRLLQLQELGVIPQIRTRRVRFLPTGGAARVRGDDAPTPVLSLRVSGEPAAAAPRLRGADQRFSLVAEAYRSATFSILLAGKLADRSKKYVVSSPNAGDGKTTIVSNLGIALSRSQRRIVVVDGDLRKPGLHKALGLENTAGMREVLRGEVDPQHAPLSAFCQSTGFPNLFVLTAGSGGEESTELLHSPRAGELLARLGREFDLVLIDTPPMLHMADARIFANQADGVILVFHAGSTNLEEAISARDLFVQDRVRVLGTILNGFNPAREGKAKYYDSYYRYKQVAEAIEEPSTAL